MRMNLQLAVDVALGVMAVLTIIGKVSLPIAVASIMIALVLRRW